jgi:shikimate dehydrogenase
MPSVPRASRPPDGLVLLGQPVAQSLSPQFQNAALRAVGREVLYTAREVAADNIPFVLETCRESNTGGNVTMPHKRIVYDAAGQRTESATRTGAVNTFWWEQRTLVGHNTDVDGIRATVFALCAGGVPGDVVLLGAGGSAAAVLVALADLPIPVGGRVHVVARSVENAEALCARTGVTAVSHPSTAVMDWAPVRLVINATPLGMGFDDPLPLDVSVLSANTAVFDLVYRQQGTALVHAARARGLRAEDGLRMLVEQGASAFECWFNTPAPRAAMWQSLGLAVPPAHAPRA